MAMGTSTGYSLSDYYLTSLAVGLKSLVGRYPREAASRLVNPLSYPRYMEYRLALSALGDLDGCRVLDIGSPKLPVLVIADRNSCELYATDIRDYFVRPTAHFLRRMGHGDRLGRDIHLEVQDARALAYPDGFFDKIFSISVIEHIPDSGDSEAMRDLARVLRPGGLVTITTPFCAAGYFEEFVEGPVYERNQGEQPTFYQRHYDLIALDSRLIEPSGLRLVKRTFFGEPKVQFEGYWNRIPMKWKVPLLWAQPFLAKVFLKTLNEDQLACACGVALTFVKP